MRWLVQEGTGGTLSSAMRAAEVHAGEGFADRHTYDGNRQFVKSLEGRHVDCCEAGRASGSCLRFIFLNINPKCRVVYTFNMVL